MLFVTLHCYLFLYKILITNPEDLKEALKKYLQHKQLTVAA